MSPDSGNLDWAYNWKPGRFLCRAASDKASGSPIDSWDRSTHGHYLLRRLKILVDFFSLLKSSD